MSQELGADPRFLAAVALFNSGDWYPCHDGFEELWHQTLGPDRDVLQSFLQIAVAHLHLERGNRRGATLLLGEGLGRLAPFPLFASVSTSPRCGIRFVTACSACRATETPKTCPCPSCSQSHPWVGEVRL